MKKALGPDLAPHLQMNMLFEHPTIGDLANAINLV